MKKTEQFTAKKNRSEDIQSDLIIDYKNNLLIVFMEIIIKLLHQEP